MIDNIKIIFKIGKPNTFSASEIKIFLDLLKCQGKVKDPNIYRIKKCNLLAIAFCQEEAIAIGSIKMKTDSVFNKEKADVPELGDFYEWEVGYFFTRPEYSGKGYSSLILNELLSLYGSGALMASTVAYVDNPMVKMLEKRGFKETGKKWKSKIIDELLQLYVRSEVLILK